MSKNPAGGKDFRGVPQSSGPPGPVTYTVTSTGNTQGEDYDVESGDEGEENMFVDKFVRRSFIRNVYAILTVQLMVTFIIVLLFVTVEELTRFGRDLLKERRAYLYILIGFFVSLWLTLACCPRLRRRSPENYVALGLFTLVSSLLFGMVDVFFELDEVLMAIGITVAVSFVLTLFSCAAICDFTGLGGSLLSFSVTLVFFGLAGAIRPDRIAYIGYFSLGAFAFCIYCVINTQLMMGGKHKRNIAPEEYVYAVLSLYMDVMNIFLYLLRMVGLSRRK